MKNIAELSWKTSGRKVVYQGRVSLVEHQVTLPDGSASSYEVDESIPFAVATLIYDGENILLSRQYRYPIDRWIFDLPGGAAEPGEQPAEAARREVEEELGLVAGDLRLLHTFYSNPGRVAWPTHLFFCDAVSSGNALRSDPAEQVHLVGLPLSDLDVLIAGREIVDPTLLVARALAAATGLLPALSAPPRGGLPLST